MNVIIRAGQATDAVACGQISYAAFKSFRERHGFPAHFTTVEAAIGRARFCINHPSIYGLVAEYDGQVIGSNFLDERDPIRGLGPITVDPHVQAKGSGVG